MKVLDELVAGLCSCNSRFDLFFFQTPALILSNDSTLFVYGLLVPADEGANTEFKSEVVGRNKKKCLNTGRQDGRSTAIYSFIYKL